jgi:LPXTG-motif cell wall-anchored protein
MLSKKMLVRSSAVAVSAGLMLSLSGCVAQVEVDSAGGIGECDSVPVSISTSQNALGDNVTVEYTGPEAISLFFVHGFYSDTKFDGLMDTRLLGMGDLANMQNIEDNNAQVTKLDTSSDGWTQSGSANTTSYTFTGSAAELLDGQAVLGQGYDAIVPGAVAINCDPTAVTETLLAGEFGGDLGAAIVENYSFAAAQPLYPNHVNIDPFVILTQEPDGTGGIQGTLRLADSTAATFGSFVPVLLDENSLTLFADMPEVTNDSFGNLWFQLFADSNETSSTMILTAPEPTQSLIGQDISFQWSGEGELATGDFLAAIPMENADASEQKLVFFSLSYDLENGLTVTSPLNPAPETVEPAAPSAPSALAATGTDSVIITFAAGLSALLVLAGAGLALARRRQG